MKITRSLVALLALLICSQGVVLGGSGIQPGPGYGSGGGGGGVFVDGAKVGSVSGKAVFVRTDTGAVIDPICMAVQMQFGPDDYGAAPGTVWASYPAVTSGQWAAGIQKWYNSLSTAGKPYGQINCIRLMIASPVWLALTGISDNGGTSAAAQYTFVCTDTNGRNVYTAGIGGSPGCGSGPGHEVAGDPTTYQNAVKNTIANILGASSTLGYPMYVIINNMLSAPIWNVTGQVVMPVDQPSMPSPADIPMWQQLAALYGDDHRIMFELYNEPFGTNQDGSDLPFEASFLGNSNGTNTTYNFPTTATSPNTPPQDGYNYIMGISSGQCIVDCRGTAGSPNTAQSASMQQISNAIRTAGGHNIIIIGNLIADEHPEDSPANGGNEHYTDTYTIGGLTQTAWAIHTYAYSGSLTNLSNIQAAGMPIIGTEAGSIVGGGGSGSGYVAYRSNNWGYTWCCWANFYGVPLPNLYSDVAPATDNGAYGYSQTFTISGMSPFNAPNVPVGNNGSNTSQIPTGSNFRPAPPLARLHGHAANDERFERLMTGTGMY